MHYPLVTIAAINYNNAPYVIETLNSIKQQTYPNIEFIIIDDCSTDNSVEIINQWLKDYNKQYRMIVHKKNLGVCAAANTAMQVSKGKYLVYIATDDVMMPGAISNQVELLENTADDVCAVYSDAYLIKEDSSPRFGLYMQRYRDFEDAPTGYIFDELLNGNFIPGFAMLVKLNCYKEIGGFDETLVFEDYDMLLRLAKKYKFIFSDFISFKYRIRKNSLSTKIKNWYAARLKILAKHADYSHTVIEAMERTARNAYYERDEEALNELFKYKHLSNYIATLNLLWKFRVPRSLVRSMGKMGKTITRKTE